ncbi:PREDICTED: DNA helicase PIF1 [Prunus dulcis]|uniref:PREDICTED: DNA helicase PIF1 n=1 Tax=Prunus dulcis TaxID=3755 RepID=A0A5E4EBM8_PRUDU|nr:PREDICTED: DNA helicase PIF1 [Prunus dulcis]
MFDQTNELVKLFRTIRDSFEKDSLPPQKITLLGRQSNDGKQYEQPTCDEIGGLIVGDIGLFDSNRDIIIEFKSGELKRVTKLHPKYMSLQYPLLFPFGEDGYTPDLKYHCTNYGSKRKRISMRAFIAYQIQERAFQFDTLLKGGRLFQQFLVDAYATLEED